MRNKGILQHNVDNSVILYHKNDVNELFCIPRSREFCSALKNASLLWH